jgi:hypothetical protein
MVARPPLALNWFWSPKAVFCASQKASVRELPVTPSMVDAELGMTTQFGHRTV